VPQAKRAQRDDDDDDDDSGAMNSKIPLIIAAWVVASSTFNISSKSLASEPPLFITLSQFAWTLLVDVVFLYSVKRRNMAAYLRGPLQACVTIGLALVSANGAMMWALTRTTVATFQTIKASSPLFTAAICALFLNRFYTSNTYLTLVPIMLGLVLCTGAEVELEAYGFAACLLSSVAQVFGNLSAKALYESKFDDLDGVGSHPRGLEPIEVQMLVSAVGCVISAILLATSQLDSASPLPSLSPALLVNVVLYFSENTLAYSANLALSRLPYAVADALRRLVIVIVSNAVLVNAPTSPIKALGVVYIISGSVLFSVVVEEVKVDVDKD